MATRTGSGIGFWFRAPIAPNRGAEALLMPEAEARCSEMPALRGKE